MTWGPRLCAGRGLLRQQLMPLAVCSGDAAFHTLFPTDSFLLWLPSARAPGADRRAVSAAYASRYGTTELAPAPPRGHSCPSPSYKNTPHWEVSGKFRQKKKSLREAHEARWRGKHVGWDQAGVRGGELGRVQPHIWASLDAPPVGHADLHFGLPRLIMKS